LSKLAHVVDDLRSAIRDGGTESLYQAHQTARRSCLSYRILYGLANVFLPINPLFDIVRDIDRQIGELGAAGGAEAVLARPSIPWKREFLDGSLPTMQTHPVIVYGRHGSILTPLLIAAAVGRADEKMIAASYIDALGPNIHEHSFPVYTTTPLSVRLAGRKGLVPRLVGWLAYKLDPPTERTEAKRKNQVALMQATDYVRRGGALLIAPDPRNRGGAWRPGIGVIIAALAETPAQACDCLLIPFRIWNASMTGIYQLLSRNPMVRALGRWRFRHPVKIVFGPPQPLRGVVAEAGTDPKAITQYLERRYRELGF